MSLTKKIVAVLACRLNGTRLFGKPLQNLDFINPTTILDHQIINLKRIKEIDSIVLAIAEGAANQEFIKYAHYHQLKYVVGSEEDVLGRILLAAEAAAADTVFRVTTECPYIAWEMIPEACTRHVINNNDITVTDYMPEGVNFELLDVSALRYSYTHDQSVSNLEHTTVFFRQYPELFKIEIILPPEVLRRLDLRLTVDYPEDLVLCRKIYENFKNVAPYISIDKIIAYLDEHPEAHMLVEPFVNQTPVWASAFKK